MKKEVKNTMLDKYFEDADLNTSTNEHLFNMNLLLEQIVIAIENK